VSAIETVINYNGFVSVWFYIGDQYEMMVFFTELRFSLPAFALMGWTVEDMEHNVKLFSKSR
jgi:hypothetical protein